MEEQMINMLSIIVEQVRDKQDLFEDAGRIMQALVNDGYHIDEADAALMLMQNIVQKHSEELLDAAPFPHDVSIRSMSREERARFTMDAFGFVCKLTHLGILSADQREAAIEKALSLYPQRIAREHIKSLIGLVLLAPVTQEESGSNAAARRHKLIVWN